MKEYSAPEFVLYKIDLVDAICNSPVEQYATQEVTEQPTIDPGTGGGGFDDGF